MNDGLMVLYAPCIRCNTMLACDPETVPSVFVHELTRCPINPELQQVQPGQPGVAKEPLCAPCYGFLHALAGEAIPINQLFPHHELAAHMVAS